MHVILIQFTEYDFGQEIVAKCNLKEKAQHHEWHGFTLLHVRQIYRIEAGNLVYVSFFSFFIIYKYFVFHRFIARLACMRAG